MELTSAQNRLILETDERLRELERQAAIDPEARAAYRQELRRLAGLEEIKVVRCMGIYRSDDYAFDSDNLLFAASEELADMVIDLLNEADESSYKKRWWSYRTAIAELDDVLLTQDEANKKVSEFIENNF